MISDKQLEFSSAQAFTSAAASTNTIDLEVALRDIGNGNPLYIYSIVATTFTDSSSNSQIVVTLQWSNTELSGYAPAVTASSTDTTATVLPALGGPVEGGQILYVIPAVQAVATSTTAKPIWVASINPQAIPGRYIRVLYTPINGDVGAGALTTRMSLSSPIWKATADGISIQ